MHSKSSFGILLCLISCLFAYTFIVAQTNKPNVIIINADDLGYGDIGIQGATKVRTSAMDLLASEGRRFTDFHAASAVCSHQATPC
ncbi:sulfatase-like hydrolase/transferase [Flagellimonas meridianipacifica]|uniref:sulfatase-like hydrolase/transferase n=1 Tax=Flagellimonas meridianipacifica TaxID=1080225 RepID=UPI001B80AE02